MALPQDLKLFIWPRAFHVTLNTGQLIFFAVQSEKQDAED